MRRRSELATPEVEIKLAALLTRPADRWATRGGCLDYGLGSRNRSLLLLGVLQDWPLLFLGRGRTDKTYACHGAERDFDHAYLLFYF